MGIGVDLQQAADEASARGEPYMAVRSTMDGKTKFVKGDRVRVVAAPPQGDDRQVHPTWVDRMDKCAGREGKVTHDLGSYFQVDVDDIGIWNFRDVWLEPVVERAKVVPPADLADPKAVFEAQDPVPAEPDPKRRRMSNALYAVLADVTKLEGDFQYQYDYGRELVEELAQVKKDAAERVRKAEAQRDGYGRDYRSQEEEFRKCISQRDEARRINGTLAVQLKKAMRPSRLLKWLAITGWLAAVLSGGVLAFEKISATPVDTLVRKAIMNLHSEANEATSE